MPEKASGSNGYSAWRAVGWTHAALAFALLVAFVVRELRTEQPVVDLLLLKKSPRRGKGEPGAAH